MNPLPSLSLSSYRSPRRNINHSYHKKPMSHHGKNYGSKHSSPHKQHHLLGSSNNKPYIWSGSQYNQRQKPRETNPYIKSPRRQPYGGSKMNKFSNPYEPSPPRQRQQHPHPQQQYHHHQQQHHSRHYKTSSKISLGHSPRSNRRHRNSNNSYKISPRHTNNHGVPKLGLEKIWAQKTSHFQSDHDANNTGPLSSRVQRKPRGIGHLSAVRQPNSARVGGSSYDSGNNYNYNNHHNYHGSRQHQQGSQYHGSHRQHKSKSKSKKRYVGIGTNHQINKMQPMQPIQGTGGSHAVGGLLSMPHSIAVKGRGGGAGHNEIPGPPSKSNVSDNGGGGGGGGGGGIGAASLTITNSSQIQQNLEQQQQKQLMTKQKGSVPIPPPPLPITGSSADKNKHNNNAEQKISSNNNNNNNEDNSKADRKHRDRGDPKRGDKDNERSNKDGSVMTPAEAFKKHMTELSDHEHGEILEYSKIYYCGNGEKKVRKHKGNNRGYDDDRGDYKIVMNDHIGYRFEIISTVGKGSFGQVVKCYDYKHNTMCALKIIRNKKRFHQQAKVEVNILKHLKKNDVDRSSNIIHLKEHFYFRGHLCITFDLMSVNLYEFIKNNNFQGVSLGLIRRFAVQLLTSLKFLSSQNIIHCDLKPENILLKKSNRSGIRVIDLGSSCFVDERVYTYIQSRFYRAPEIILGLPYGTPIDMWSFACILAELYTGYPLFPGENEQQQLICIMEIMGEPSSNMIEKASRRKLFFDSRNKPRLIADSRGRKRLPGAKNLAHVLKCKDKSFIDFLQKCLTWDPKSRYTAVQAMSHSWVLDGPAPPPSKSSGLPQINHGRRRRY